MSDQECLICVCGGRGVTFNFQFSSLDLRSYKKRPASGMTDSETKPGQYRSKHSVDSQAQRSILSKWHHIELCASRLHRTR